jgi:hypothetical protein
MASTVCAHAVITTSVTLAGNDDARFKPGVPGIALRVESEGNDAIAVVSREISRELERQVYTRALHEGDLGDFDLVVAVGKVAGDGPVVEVPFSAELTGAQGERVWRVEGRTEVADEVVGHSAFIGIARNVVAALLHDGWVAQRIDPDDPPPPAPEIRLEPVR